MIYGHRIRGALGDPSVTALNPSGHPDLRMWVPVALSLVRIANPNTNRHVDWTGHIANCALAQGQGNNIKARRDFEEPFLLLLASHFPPCRTGFLLVKRVGRPSLQFAIPVQLATTTTFLSSVDSFPPFSWATFT